MRKSQLVPIQGTEINTPSWNLDSIDELLGYAGESFIYVAQIYPNQYAIIHWGDIEDIKEVEGIEDLQKSGSQLPNDPDKTVKEFMENFYTRKLVIPMSIEEINGIKNGTLAIREIYLKHKIYLIEGMNNCEDEIRVWEDCSDETLEEYLPTSGHTLSDR